MDKIRATHRMKRMEERDPGSNELDSCRWDLLEVLCQPSSLRSTS